MAARILLVVLLALCLTACRGNAPATAMPTAMRPAASVPASATPDAAGTPSPSRPAAATPVTYPTVPLPAGCDDDAILGVVRDFIAAYNVGDQAGLARVFPAKGSDGDHPWTGDPNQLRWFTLVRANPAKGVDGLNLYNRDTLLAYFAERHAQHERMRMVELVVNHGASGPGAAAINFRIARAADDLPESEFPGKGGVGCQHGVIYLWSQGGAPLALATPATPAPPATPAFACPATQPNGSTPPGERPASSNHGNGALWVALWPEGTVIIPADQAQRDGSLAVKFPWWRGPGVRGALTITGRRLDAPAPPFTANIPGGYGDTGFQATGIIFPTYGCWEVTGRAGDASLTFVTLVVAVAPPPTPGTPSR